MEKINKLYVIDFLKYHNCLSKLIILYVIGTGLLGALFSSIAIVVKVILCIASAFVFIMNYYRTKYLIGLKKHPLKVNEEEDMLEYYNEYRGVVKLKVSKIRSIKVFSRKNFIYLIELNVLGTKEQENINTEGFYQESVMEFIQDLKIINPSIICESNHKEEGDNV